MFLSIKITKIKKFLKIVKFYKINDKLSEFYRKKLISGYIRVLKIRKNNN